MHGDSLIIVNFSHPLTEEHLQALRELTGSAKLQLVSVPCQFDHGRSFAEQAREMIDGIGLTPEQWQTQAIVINPPALSAIACVVLAELHGRMGYFPPIIRLRPVEGAVPRFEVAEVINLQQVRERARQARH
ncbi:MAG: hypothetical protein H5T86_12150 [Armatimonadetes bacterium]|nr:hypothetical protein [Armatimonadota bacterium]